MTPGWFGRRGPIDRPDAATSTRRGQSCPVRQGNTFSRANRPIREASTSSQPHWQRTFLAKRTTGNAPARVQLLSFAGRQNVGRAEEPSFLQLPQPFRPPFSKGVSRRGPAPSSTNHFDWPASYVLNITPTNRECNLSDGRLGKTSKDTGCRPIKGKKVRSKKGQLHQQLVIHGAAARPSQAGGERPGG